MLFAYLCNMIPAKRLAFSIILIATITFSSGAQNFSDPVVYNDYLIDEQSDIITKSLEYLTFSIQSEDFDAIEKKRLNFLTDIRRSMNKIRRMPDYQGTNRLKRETLDVFGEYLKIYETDLIEVLGLKKQYKDSYLALEAYLEAEKKVDDKLKKALENLSKAQEAFAKKYDLKVSEQGGSELIDRVNHVSELSKYSRAVFMEYFKVSWEFNEMVKILHEKNGRKLEKKRIDVLDATTAALNNLKSIERYRDEKEYMDLTIDLIEYFRTLSRKEFARVAGIFKKDNMSEKDADYVNKVFADYNANIEILVVNWNLANKYLWQNNVN